MVEVTWMEIVLPAVISIISAVLITYLTARLTIKQEVKKEIAIKLTSERFDKFLKEASSWVNKMRKDTPPPRFTGDVSSFMKLLDKYSDWVSDNIGTMNSLDPNIANLACAFRDHAFEYMQPIERNNEDLNRLYKELIDGDLSHLSQFSRAVVEAHKSILNP